MNLHIKTSLDIKNYVWDLNSDVENENFLTDFSWQIWAKNTKIIFSSESVKTKEHKESNSCDKYYFSINAFYKINFWPILKKLSQKIDFGHFPLFEIIAHKQKHPAGWWQRQIWCGRSLKQTCCEEFESLRLLVLGVEVITPPRMLRLIIKNLKNQIISPAVCWILQPDSGGKAGRLADLCLKDLGAILRLDWGCIAKRGREGRGEAQGNVGKG